MRVIEPEKLSADDVERFNHCAKYHQFATSSTWKDLCEHMDDLVAEALASMRGNISGSAERAMYFQTRWQQRDSMAVALKQYVQSLSDEYVDSKNRLNEEEAWQQQ